MKQSFMVVCNPERFDLESYFKDRRQGASGTGFEISWRYKPSKTPPKPPKLGDTVWVFRAKNNPHGIVAKGIILKSPLPSSEINSEIRGQKYWHEGERLRQHFTSILIKIEEESITYNGSSVNEIVSWDQLKNHPAYQASHCKKRNMNGTIFYLENDLANAIESMWCNELSHEPSNTIFSSNKSHVNLRLDNDVILSIKKAALEKGLPYQTLINSFLKNSFVAKEPSGRNDSNSWQEPQSLIERIENLERLVMGTPRLS
ncbi:MAG: hypothetical protein KA436_08245 [Oligoflexales bacterium]|nr:hypothetical protein [Oligoflexales bacterium]